MSQRKGDDGRKRCPNCNKLGEKCSNEKACYARRLAASARRLDRKPLFGRGKNWDLLEYRAMMNREEPMV